MTFPTPRRVAALIPVLAVSAAVAACGGSEDADFVDSYNKAVAPLNTMMTDLGTTSPSDSAAASKSLAKVADGLEGVHTNLSKLDPPSDAADEFDKMLGALDKGSDQVRAMAGAARSGDVEKLSKATTDFSKTGTDLASLEQQLRSIVEN
jgi:hypothetical protein